MAIKSPDVVHIHKGVCLIATHTLVLFLGLSTVQFLIVCILGAHTLPESIEETLLISMLMYWLICTNNGSILILHVYINNHCIMLAVQRCAVDCKL